jgi:hypothetical protein
MPTTHRTHTLRTAAGAAAAALLCVAALFPATGQAASKTKTLRFFSHEVSFTFTTAAGVVSHQPPNSAPQPGDVLESNSLDYAGNHRHHAKRYSASDSVQCTFTTSTLEPDCFAWVAHGGSLLHFHGNDLIGGTGRYQGATGRVVQNQDVPGGSDIVVKLHLR